VTPAGVAQDGTEPCWEITGEDGAPFNDEFNPHYASEQEALAELAQAVTDDPELYVAGPLIPERAAELAEADAHAPTVLIVVRVSDEPCWVARCAGCEAPSDPEERVMHWPSSAEALEAAVDPTAFAVDGSFAVQGEELLCGECARAVSAPAPDGDRRPGLGQLALDAP
jgi:hypothetical protein